MTKPGPRNCKTRIESIEFWLSERHPEIAGYRGRPGGDEDEAFWNPEKPPCVPSDPRPSHLFGTRVAAEAACAAARVECCAPKHDPEDTGLNDWRDEQDDEDYEVACVQHKVAVRRLERAFPELGQCPLDQHASHYQTRPCPCGRGALAKWPWVVQMAQHGFCDCPMAGWELICWRREWARNFPQLGW